MKLAEEEIKQKKI